MFVNKVKTNSFMDKIVEDLATSRLHLKELINEFNKNKKVINNPIYYEKNYKKLYIALNKNNRFDFLNYLKEIELTKNEIELFAEKSELEMISNLSKLKDLLNKKYMENEITIYFIERLYKNNKLMMIDFLIENYIINVNNIPIMFEKDHSLYTFINKRYIYYKVKNSMIDYIKENNLSEDNIIKDENIINQEKAIINQEKDFIEQVEDRHEKYEFEIIKKECFKIELNKKIKIINLESIENKIDNNKDIHNLEINDISKTYRLDNKNEFKNIKYFATLPEDLINMIKIFNSKKEKWFNPEYKNNNITHILGELVRNGRPDVIEYLVGNENNFVNCNINKKQHKNILVFLSGIFHKGVWPNVQNTIYMDKLNKNNFEELIECFELLVKIGYNPLAINNAEDKTLQLETFLGCICLDENPFPSNRKKELYNCLVKWFKNCIYINVKKIINEHINVISEVNSLSNIFRKDLILFVLV